MPKRRRPALTIFAQRPVPRREHFTAEGKPKVRWLRLDHAEAHADCINGEAYTCRTCGFFHVGRGRPAPVGRLHWHHQFMMDELEMGQRVAGCLRQENKGPWIAELMIRGYGPTLERVRRRAAA